MRPRFLALPALLLLAGCVSEELQPGEPPFTKATQEDLERVEGTYVYHLDGLRKLRIDLDGAYKEDIEGSCFETPPDKGDVGRDGGVIVLRPSKRRMDRIRMVPVRWGDRRYLLEERDLPEFCLRVRSGEEPRRTSEGIFYLREGDWERPAAGQPDVPEAYRVYFSAEARFGKITWLDASGKAWASLGEGKVTAGQRVYVEGKYGWEDAEVVELKGETSVVKLVVEGELKAGARVATVKPGR